MRSNHEGAKKHEGHKVKIAFAALIAVIAAGFAVAQLMEAPPSPASLFPQGALVYVETRDLNRLLSWWKDSQVRAAWLETNNYTDFTNSRLYQRLDERLAALGKGQFAFTLENLIEVSGTRSALALYDIGELKAVAVTRVGFAEASASELWASRANLKKRKIGNQNYYIEPQDGKLAFAFANPYLVIASEESLLLDVLKAMNDPQATGRITQSEKWQQLASRGPQDNSLISLFLDQENLNTNRYFQNYWIYQNADELKDLKAARIDLNLQDGAIVEHRYFIRDESAAGPALQDPGESIKPFEAVHHENLSVIASPDAARAVADILSLLNRLPAGQPVPGAPPVYSAAAERLSKAEARSSYIERIDEPILTPAADKLLRLDQPERLQALLVAAVPSAEIRSAYPLWDDKALFVQFPASIAVQFGQFESLNRQEFLALLLEYFRSLHSTQDQGAAWVQRGTDEFALGGIIPVYVKFQNPWVLISSREQEFHETAAALPRSFAASNAFYQEIEIDQARWKYERVMKRLDTGAYSGDTPPFFSGNLNSLIQASQPLSRVTIARNKTEELIRYELK